jgi:hypothetical protein
MIQEILVIITVLTAVVYLVRFIRRQYFSDKSKCEGCALHQIKSAQIKR